jgi:CheY-like chemotaxis protein
MFSSGTAGDPIDILLVEDNPGDVELTRESLAEGKIYNNLWVAENGEQALDFLYRRGDHSNAPRPDLILLDLNLPGTSGHEVLEVIKDDTELRAIPVVILTSSAAEEDIARSYNLHANCYVTKPVDFQQFSKVVRSVESFWFTVVKLPTRGRG